MPFPILKAPFPWFGGKSRVAPEVWDRFGHVDPVNGVKMGSAPMIEGVTQRLTNPAEWNNDGKDSLKRKETSAMIAKIPFPLARHIAHVYRTIGERPIEAPLQTSGRVANERS